MQLRLFLLQWFTVLLTTTNRTEKFNSIVLIYALPILNIKLSNEIHFLHTDTHLHTHTHTQSLMKTRP